MNKRYKYVEKVLNLYYKSSKVIVVNLGGHLRFKIEDPICTPIEKLPYLYYHIVVVYI